ncbi:hypothetical protein AGMMS49925_07980 [Deltaproteobacteria bacterium]|nr:hypothetical protein AGMMS49925_07980 [Deltaproteobacteria bacterium]
MQLSGGMAQRVALARSLARRAELFLLDEPFSSLDAITRGTMQKHLLSITRKYRSSALVVTHDMDEGIMLADRLILAETGTAQSVRIGYLPITDSSPLLIAHANKLFEAEGLSVEKPRMFRSWSQVVEAFMAGQVNLVHLLSPITVWARFGSKFPARVNRLEPHGRIRPERSPQNCFRKRSGRQKSGHTILVFHP